MHRLDTQKTRRLNAWSKYYPKTQFIEVKNTNKNADWGDKFEAIVTVHRDKHRRARRVWTPLSGGEPTRKELAAKWPEGEQARVQRKLRDEGEIRCDSLWEEKDSNMVTEKLGVDGRRFWREVIPKGKSTAEELFLGWDEMMREEGFCDEIGQWMRKNS